VATCSTPVHCEALPLIASRPGHHAGGRPPRPAASVRFVAGAPAAVPLDLVAVDFTQEIKELRATMDSVRGVTDLDSLHAQIKELEARASAPDLWDDPEAAQQVTSALSRANAERDRVVGMDARIDDLETLVEMATEDGGDAETLAEAERELTQIKKVLGELEVRTLLSGEYDEREAVVTIRSGAGGVDAADFAEMLMRMYLRWAERHGYPTQVLDTSYAEEAGLKSATFEVKVPYAFGNLSVEAGTHRLVRISPFDNQGRRQTSFAAVEVIPLIEQTDHIDIPENEIKVDVFRSSGPGGQSVNTTDSAVRMTHIPTGIVVSMQNEKSQIQNRAAALRVLQSRLLLQKKAEEAATKKEMAGDVKASWGDQMRSYVLQPYQMVKDLRTEHEVGNPSAVFDGDIDGFIEAGIRWRKEQEKAGA
jgi:peptide chain release factor 2